VTRHGKVDWKAIYRRTQECLDREGMRYSPTTLMRSLSTSDIQMLEILKAISFDAKILIMDEPSSSISIKGRSIC
jgi:inositol transport system ATP-binding protein